MDSRRVIVALSICLGASLLAIGFLVGRESGRAAAPATPSVAAPIAIAAPAPAPSPMPPTPPIPTVTAPTPPAPPTIDVSAKEAVARYFRAVNRLQNTDVDNPEAMAQSLVSGAAAGDTSGLRRLDAQASDVERKVRAIVPPPPCAHYHDQLVTLLSQSREQLRQLERGLSGGDLDPAALTGAMGQAQALKSRADALADEERELKRRFGIAR